MKTLGIGASSKIKLGFNPKKSCYYAIKIINKHWDKLIDLEQEAKILK